MSYFEDGSPLAILSTDPDPQYIYTSLKVLIGHIFQSYTQ